MSKIKVVKKQRHPARETIKSANKRVAEKLLYMKNVLSTNFILDK